ncbi:MAG: AzlC family ABC transporter permease [Microthrixaceae bacterium]
MSRTHLLAGARSSAALAAGVLPFGIVYGVAVSEAGVGVFTGMLGSLGVFAGASQLSLVELHVEGASWAVAVGTALVINARFILYSAALAPAFSAFPPRWRFGLPHLMTDQATAVSLVEFESLRDPTSRRWFFLGAGMMLYAFWQLGTLVGILGGTQVPESLQLGFIIPLMFTAVALPSIRNRPTIVAAVVSVLVAIVAHPLPAGTNILLGAFTGLLVASMLVGPDDQATYRREVTGGDGSDQSPESQR